jgi:aspartate/methionine/tyrosine aminotransferase
MIEPRELLFPYMFWAHAESFRSPYCLAQSGMPVPEGSWLGGLTAEEVLAHPAVEAKPRLEARLAELYGVEPARVLVTVGATGGMHLAALRWFRRGATVASETPGYGPYAVLPRHLGAIQRAATRRLEDGWQLDPERLARTLAGARPGHLFMTNPHNPSGAVLDAPRVRALADVCARTGGVLVSCEIYMEYAPTTDQRVHAALAAPRGVTIGGLTKAFGLGALRIGWIILGAELVHEREALTDLSYLTWIDPPTATMNAALRALEHLPALLQPLRRVEIESRPHLVRWLRETDGVEATEPPFGILSFPRVRGVADTAAFQGWLAAEHGVDVVAGEHFQAPAHLRVCCGVPEATLVEGLRRLGDALRIWQERGGV